MISVLTPTRGRPEWLTRMVESLHETSSGDVEAVLYVDDDDPDTIDCAADLKAKYGTLCRVGPRLTMSRYWNELLPLASGDFFLHGNDDIVFRTPGWDRMVDYYFSFIPDKIAFVYGSDEGQHFENFGAHGIVHRKWVETVGYFIPPHFSSDYGDTWLNEVAKSIGRSCYLPFIVEHLHFMFAKAPLDETYRARLERHYRDHNHDIWVRTQPERERDAEKLRQSIDSFKLTPVCP